MARVAGKGAGVPPVPRGSRSSHDRGCGARRAASSVHAGPERRPSAAPSRSPDEAVETPFRPRLRARRCLLRLGLPPRRPRAHLDRRGRRRRRRLGALRERHRRHQVLAARGHRPLERWAAPGRVDGPHRRLPARDVRGGDPRPGGGRGRGPPHGRARRRVRGLPRRRHPLRDDPPHAGRQPLPVDAAQPRARPRPRDRSAAVGVRPRPGPGRGLGRGPRVAGRVRLDGSGSRSRRSMRAPRVPGRPRRPALRPRRRLRRPLRGLRQRRRGRAHGRHRPLRPTELPGDVPTGGRERGGRRRLGHRRQPEEGCRAGRGSRLRRPYGSAAVELRSHPSITGASRLGWLGPRGSPHHRRCQRVVDHLGGRGAGPGLFADRQRRP
jgi:hypothetical protein